MPATNKFHTGRSEDAMRVQFAADFATGRVTAASCHRCGYGVGVTLEHSCAKCGGAVVAHVALPVAKPEPKTPGLLSEARLFAGLRSLGAKDCAAGRVPRCRSEYSAAAYAEYARGWNDAFDAGKRPRSGDCKCGEPRFTGSRFCLDCTVERS